jgi:ethanolamine utilization protein EutQ (cupin superfamily)
VLRSAGRHHLRIGHERLVLAPGDMAFVPIRTKHCFFTTDGPATFHAELRPAPSRSACGVWS